MHTYGTQMFPNFKYLINITSFCSNVPKTLHFYCEFVNLLTFVCNFQLLFTLKIAPSNYLRKNYYTTTIRSSNYQLEL